MSIAMLAMQNIKKKWSTNKENNLLDFEKLVGSADYILGVKKLILVELCDLCI